MVIRPKGSRAKFNTCRHFHIDLALGWVRPSGPRRLSASLANQCFPRNQEIWTRSQTSFMIIRRRGGQTVESSVLLVQLSRSRGGDDNNDNSLERNDVVVQIQTSPTDRRVDDNRLRARVRSHRLDSVRTGGSNYCWKGEREERRKSPLNNRTDDDARRDYCYKTNNLRSRSQLSTPVADRAACTSGMTSPKKMANIRVGRGLWRFSISWSKLTTPL